MRTIPTSMTTFIDTHVHFYDEWFDQEAEDAITRSLHAGVVKMIQPDVDSTERDKMFALSEKHPGVLFTMIGLYPDSVKENWEEEIQAYLNYSSRNPVAIGEIGLDYYYSKETADLQKAALKAQFELAAKLNLPVNIHLRDATEDFLKIAKECSYLGLRGNMHAFSGSYETFIELQKYGDWSVGIGGVVTFKKAKVAESVVKIPLEKIVLETDAPYLAPVPMRGKRNESTYIPYIAQKVADLKGISLDQVAEVTSHNAETLFGI